MSEENALERRVVSKVSWRLLPYLFLLYVIAYLDRINVGVAGLQITRDLPISDQALGLGMGLFFIGYFLFEVPSNLILARVGARPWIARIMIVWGIVSVSMMFIRGHRGFFALRFLLGAAEAGFFPGILFYLTRWFREKDRARAVALFMTAGTITGVFGSPLSGSLLELDGVAHLKGWQWLFLLEGIPAILLGISVLFLLPENPQAAKWLSESEREWLKSELESERSREELGVQRTVLDTLIDRRVILLTSFYFFMACGSYGFEFWLPSIVKSLSGASNFRVTLLTAVPYIVGTVALVAVAHHSDRTGERRLHVAVCAFLASLGFMGGALFHSPGVALGSLTLAWVGIKGLHGPVWAVPPSFLSGTRAAAGIAFINSVGNLGGLVGPWMAGFLKERSHSFTYGLMFSGILLLVASRLALGLPASPRPASGEFPSGPVPA
jgi:ACS family tartrate transporter-like MFS transporter